MKTPDQGMPTPEKQAETRETSRERVNEELKHFGARIDDIVSIVVAHGFHEVELEQMKKEMPHDWALWLLQLKTGGFPSLDKLPESELKGRLSLLPKAASLISEQWNLDQDQAAVFGRHGKDSDPSDEERAEAESRDEAGRLKVLQELRALEKEVNEVFAPWVSRRPLPRE